VEGGRSRKELTDGGEKGTEAETSDERELYQAQILIDLIYVDSNLELSDRGECLGPL
jgi:hypothetical protein